MRRVFSFIMRKDSFPLAARRGCSGRSAGTATRTPRGRALRAWARSVTLLKPTPSNRSTAARREAAVGSRKTRPVRPGITVSSPPPSPKTTAGRPQAMASRGTMPKSSTPGMTTARQPAVEVAQGARPTTRPGRSPRAAPARRRRASSGPLPTMVSGPARAPVGLEHQLEPLVGSEGRRPRGRSRPGSSGPGVKKSTSTGRRDHLGLAAVVAADAAGDVRAVGGEAVDARGRWPRPRPAGPRPRWARARRAGPGARPGRSSRRSGPTRSAWACGSSRRARAPGPRRDALGHAVRARDHEVEAARSRDAAAAGKRGR